MAVVRRTLDVPGRLRLRASIVDARGRSTGTIRRGVLGSRFARGTDADGTTWRVNRDLDRFEILREGELRAVVLGSDLTVGGRSFVWRVAHDGTREAQVTALSETDDDDPGFVLRIRPPLPRDERTGDLEAWAILEIDDVLPDAFGVVLAACARLLQVGGSGHWTPTKPPEFPDQGPNPNGDNMASAMRYGSGV